MFSLLPWVKYDKMSYCLFLLRLKKLKHSRRLIKFVSLIMDLSIQKSICYLSKSQWQVFKNTAMSLKLNLTYFRSIWSISKFIMVLAKIQEIWKPPELECQRRNFKKSSDVLAHATGVSNKTNKKIIQNITNHQETND